MQQINEDTGTARPVVRKVNSLGVSGQNSAAGDTGKMVLSLAIFTSYISISCITPKTIICSWSVGS